MFRRLSLLFLLVLAPALAAAQTYTISPPPFLLAQNNSGAIINNACIWTYTAGTTTPATTYTTSTGTANTNPIRSDSAGRFTAYLSPGSSYKFVYESACVPPAHGTTLRTADNISATPSSSGVVDVIGTAGESITVGQAVYLSAGDGGKTAGQWYKADSGNPYSATSTFVGIATVNISAAGTGTIRLAGSVTGLSALALGTRYYVGTSGALTGTAPAYARALGEADSATSLVLTGNPPLVLLSGSQSPLLTGCGVRLTLTAGTAVTTADVTAAATIYATPYSTSGLGAGVCAFYDGSASWTTLNFSETSIALGTITSGLPYDIFCYNNSGTMACDAPVAWTSGTTRATALALQNGIWVKTGATTRRYLGTFYTTSTTTTEDSFAKRYLWNYYNRVERPMQVVSTTNSYAYGTNTVRQSQNSTTYQLNFVVGVAEQPVQATLTANLQFGGAATFQIGFGLDTTTILDVTALGGAFTANAAIGDIFSISASITKYPAAGVHYLAWLENAPSAVNCTVFSNNSANHLYSGIRGVIVG